MDPTKNARKNEGKYLRLPTKNDSFKFQFQLVCLHCHSQYNLCVKSHYRVDKLQVQPIKKIKINYSFKNIKQQNYKSACYHLSQTPFTSSNPWKWSCTCDLNKKHNALINKNLQHHLQINVSCSFHLLNSWYFDL